MKSVSAIAEAPRGHDLVLKGRMLAQAHAFLQARYDTLLVTVIDHDFVTILEKYWTGYRVFMMFVKLSVLFLIATSLPFIYAWTIMDYPCQRTDTLLVKDEGKQHVELAQVNCLVEDQIRSPLSLAVMPLALVLSALLFYSSVLFDRLLIQCGVDEVRLGERMRNISRRYVYKFVGDQVDSLKYAHPLVFNATLSLYTIMLMEMIAISALRLSGIGAIVGYAIGKVFLMCATALATPDAAIIARIEGELRTWPQRSGGGAVGIFARLREQSWGDTIFATTEELAALWNLEALRELVEAYDVADPDEDHEWSWAVATRLSGGFLNYVRKTGSLKWEGEWQLMDMRLGAWETFPAKFVYLTDLDATVDVVEGCLVSEIDDTL